MHYNVSILRSILTFRASQIPCQRLLLLNADMLVCVCACVCVCMCVYVCVVCAHARVCMCVCLLRGGERERERAVSDKQRITHRNVSCLNRKCKHVMTAKLPLFIQSGCTSVESLGTTAYGKQNHWQHEACFGVLTLL